MRLAIRQVRRQAQRLLHGLSASGSGQQVVRQANWQATWQAKWLATRRHLGWKPWGGRPRGWSGGRRVARRQPRARGRQQGRARRIREGSGSTTPLGGERGGCSPRRYPRGPASELAKRERVAAEAHVKVKGQVAHRTAGGISPSYAPLRPHHVPMTPPPRPHGEVVQGLRLIAGCGIVIRRTPHEGQAGHVTLKSPDSGSK